MHTRGYTTLALLLAFLAGAALVGGVWFLQAVKLPSIGKTGDGVACTMEAKLCPDGSSVGRQGPDCTFAPCPTTTTKTTPPGAGKGGLTGTAMVGPTCPVEKNPPDPACADKPFVGALAVMTDDGSEVVQKFSTDAAGFFKVSLPAGSYTVESAPGSVLPRCVSDVIKVVAGVYAKVAVRCDSGIR